LIKALGQVPRLLVCFFSVLIPFKAKNDFDLFYTVKSLGGGSFQLFKYFSIFFSSEEGVVTVWPNFHVDFIFSVLSL
jgi:hypothetical protein